MKLALAAAVLVLAVVQLSSGQECKNEFKKVKQCMQGKMTNFIQNKGFKIMSRLKAARAKMDECFTNRGCNKPVWEGGDDDDDVEGPESLMEDKKKKIKECITNVKKEVRNNVKECMKDKGFPLPPKDEKKLEGLKRYLKGGFGRVKKAMKATCSALKKCPKAATCVKNRKKAFRQRIEEKLNSGKCVEKGMEVRKKLCDAAKDCTKGRKETCKDKVIEAKKAMCDCKARHKSDIRPKIEKCFNDNIESSPFAAIVGGLAGNMKQCMSEVASSKIEGDDDETGGPAAFCQSDRKNPCDMSPSEARKDLEARCEKRLKAMECLKKMKENIGFDSNSMIDQCASGEDPNPLAALLGGKGGGGPGGGLGKLFGGGGGPGGGLGAILGKLGG